MDLQGRKLAVDLQGDDVKLLQSALAQLGLEQFQVTPLQVNREFTSLKVHEVVTLRLMSCEESPGFGHDSVPGSPRHSCRSNRQPFGLVNGAFKRAPQHPRARRCELLLPDVSYIDGTLISPSLGRRPS